MDPGILRLPTELVEQVASHLTNIDIKSLRLTCKAMGNRAIPWVERVFLSANLRDVEVFRCIAGHEMWRRKIKEIVWDDTRLEDDPDKSSDDTAKADDSLNTDPSTAKKNPESEKKYPEWFVDACCRSLSTSNHTSRRLNEGMPLVDSWKYYKELLKQQQEVLEKMADAEAFVYGLQQFPSLRRVTITPAAHGLIDEPVYPTPTIRAFPQGLIYPVPRGWPMLGLTSDMPEENARWRYEMKEWLKDPEDRKRWRGFAYMMEVLAAHENGDRVIELVVDTGNLSTGINSRIFDQRCEAYDDLVTILRRPHFRRLDLAVLSEGLYFNGADWQFLRSGLLLSALEAATDMEHFSLHIQMSMCNGSFRLESEFSILQYIEDYIPMRSIFPVHRWPQLRHFGISRVVVWIDDVISLLKALPSTLQSVELNFLHVIDFGKSYMDLLSDMRSKLDWNERPVAQQPRVIMHFEMPPYRIVNGYMDNEVNEFLYNNRENPFHFLSLDLGQWGL